MVNTSRDHNHNDEPTMLFLLCAAIVTSRSREPKRDHANLV